MTSPDDCARRSMLKLAAAGVGDVPFGDLAKGILPFIPPLVGVLPLCAFPDSGR